MRNRGPSVQAPDSSYKQTLDYLYERLPMFTRIGDAALKADLTNTLELCSRLGNPQHKFKSIHIAGTNGKGSTSHMLAAILQTAGYKTGLYTSPHLKDFRERIRIDGTPIPENRVVEFIRSLKPDIEQISPSFFEVTVAMAFEFFADENVDVAVVEVGLGGRLDSTNVITPLLSVITNIGFDHVNLLGNTLPQIASEKAGIIKPSVPVIVGEKHPDTYRTFTEKANLNGSDIRFASEEWNISRNEKSPANTECVALRIEFTGDKKYRVPELQELTLDLTGSYQLKNLATVLSSVSALSRQFDITDAHISSALKRVKQLTGLLGRWQLLQVSPRVICDTGHNEDGIREVLANISAEKYKQLRMVIGMVKDKEIGKILNMLPREAVYYFCSPNLPRAKPADELQSEAESAGLSGASYKSVAAALKQAVMDADKEDLIFVGGSTFVVAEAV